MGIGHDAFPLFQASTDADVTDCACCCLSAGEGIEAGSRALDEVAEEAALDKGAGTRGIPT